MNDQSENLTILSYIMASTNAKPLPTSPLADSNLETFSLAWLDAQVNDTDENIKAQSELRSAINLWKIFHDKDECMQYIQSVAEGDRIILIVSGKLGRELVPGIYNLRQLCSIYVYCMDKKGNKEWASNFTKVR